MQTRRAALVLGLLLASGTAGAFSGTYVGPAGSQPLNRESRAVMARAGQATTLTLFNDVQAGQATFGLVVPVPVQIDVDNVRVLDPAVLEGLEAYSAPRAATATCSELYFAQGPTSSELDLDFGCSSGSSSHDDDLWFDTGTDAQSWQDETTGVVIEDRFTVGEYDAYVLQASDGAGLEAWLTAEGLSLPPGADEVLDDYIADGHYFLALRVQLDEAPAEPLWLTPVQVGFLSEQWTLPLRLGTLSSGGVQDVVVTLLTDADAGEVLISNYGDPVEIPDECLLSDPDEMLTLYDQLLAHTMGLPSTPEALDGTEGLAWAFEHRWSDGACEPCTEQGPLSRSDVEALGLPDGGESFVLTRLRLRYTPKALAEDPVLVATGREPTPIQKRYIVGSWEIAGEFPSCLGEPVADLGECYSASWLAWRESLPEGEQPRLDQEEADGCKHDRAWLLLGLPALLGLARRRRACCS